MSGIENVTEKENLWTNASLY